MTKKPICVTFCLSDDLRYKMVSLKNVDNRSEHDGKVVRKSVIIGEIDLSYYNDDENLLNLIYKNHNSFKINKKIELNQKTVDFSISITPYKNEKQDELEKSFWGESVFEIFCSRISLDVNSFYKFSTADELEITNTIFNNENDLLFKEFFIDYIDNIKEDLSNINGLNLFKDKDFIVTPFRAFTLNYENWLADNFRVHSIYERELIKKISKEKEKNNSRTYKIRL